MGGEQSQRRKRVSDGGLGAGATSDPGSVRILPEDVDENRGDTRNAMHAPTDEGEWVVEFGGAPLRDDPTSRLPLEGDAGPAPRRSGTLYTPATTPHTLPAATQSPPSPQPALAAQASQEPPHPPYATYDRTPLQAPAIVVPAPDRSLVERPPQRDERDRDDRQPVTVVKQGPSACSIFAATFGVIAIACSLLTFALVRDGFQGLGNLFGWIPNLFAPPRVSIDTSRPSVIEKISALSRLETVHYEIEKVVEGKASGPLWDIFTSDKILLIAHGDVIAGVDLSKLEPGDIKVMTNTNSVTIRLPKAEVFNPKNILDSSKTRVYDRSGGIIPMTDPNLETRIRQVAEEQILQAAIENGALDKAQKNAEEVIRSLVTGLGYKEVKFESGP